MNWRRFPLSERQQCFDAVAANRAFAAQGFAGRGGGGEKEDFCVQHGLPRGVRGRNSANSQNPRCRFLPGGR